MLVTEKGGSAISRAVSRRNRAGIVSVSCSTLRWGSEILFDSAASAMGAAFYGAGIHPGIPTLHCFRALRQKELVPVLPGWGSPLTKLFIYARSEAARLKRTQVFIERYRAFMDGLHEEAERVLEPLIGPVELRYRG